MQKSGRSSIIMTNMNQETMGRMGGMFNAQAQLALVRANAVQQRQATAAQKATTLPSKYGGGH